MQSEIDWNITPEEYRRIFAGIRRNNLLQSYEYGLACMRANGQKPRFGKITAGNKTAGIFMLLEAGILNNALHGLILDRGPLWAEGFGSEQDVKDFFTAFAAKYPGRIGRVRRIIPEAHYDNWNNALNPKHYKKHERPEYQTVLVDLTKSERELRANLKQKWRNVLNRSEKYDFVTQWDERGAAWPELRELYADDRRRRGYPGPSVKFLDTLVSGYKNSGGLLTGRILLNGKLCSAMLIFRHGRSATWQVGWTSSEGRGTGAGYRLLWQSFLELKDKGTDEFDLGGVNELQASGIRHFKIGTGGLEIRLAGHFS